MKTKILTNPFIIYIAVWLLIMIMYAFRWSTSIPLITTGVFIFFVFTFLLSALGAIWYSKSLSNKFLKSYIKIKPSKNVFLITIIINLLFGVQFVMFGMPLLQILTGVDTAAYTTFGIPFFHVLLHTFSCFYAIYVFHQAVSNKNKKLYFYFLLLLLPHALVFSRGALIMLGISAVFVLLQSRLKLRKRAIIVLVIVALIAAYIFGFTGNQRTFGGNSYMILTQSNATSSFRHGFIPNEFFWVYSYATFPLATFVHTVNYATPVGGWQGFLRFLDASILPDFITNRFQFAPNVQIDRQYLFVWFNVFSVFTDAYLTLGWLGVVLLFLFQTSLIIGYLKILKKVNPEFYVTGKSILLTITALSIFVNFWIFSALSFQLIYPLLGGLVRKRKVKIKLRLNVNGIIIKKATNKSLA